MSEAQTWKDAGRNLWFAGLGAVAETNEAGQRLFDRLVERGRPVDERQRKAVESLSGRANGAARELGKLVQDTVEYESRRLLKTLGVLTREDVRLLAARLDALEQTIAEYTLSDTGKATR
jgi:poly(hydroxyalkanoate) granule-associated protein